MREGEGGNGRGSEGGIELAINQCNDRDRCVSAKTRV